MARQNLNISGIYKIESKVHPERIYIGSAVNIRKRWMIHRRDLKKKKHHSIKLQRHYNKYKEQDLFFSVLLACDKKDLIIKEQYCIDLYKPYFNISPTAGNNTGVIMSLEAKRKQSKVRKGRFGGEKHPMFGKHHTQDTKDKLRNINLGKKLSKETKDKMSKVRTGREMSEGFGEAVSKRMMGNKNAKGFIKSQETIEKLRIASSGKIYSQESKDKMSKSHIGKKFTKEAKENLSKAITEWWAKRKEMEPYKLQTS